MYKIFFLSILLSLNSCIEFKSDYPETTFYTLSQENINNDLPSFDASILIKDIKLSSWINLDYLMEYKDNNIIERYYYHKWNNNLQSQIQNLIKNRLILQENFKNGLVHFSSTGKANYVIEIDVLDLKANTSVLEDIAYINANVKVYSNFTIEKYHNELSKVQLILNKNYEFSENRKNDKIADIPLYFSNLIAKLIDNILIDIKSKK